MRILFDHQIFYSQRIGGISRYHYELIQYLKSQGQSCSLSIFFSNNYYLKRTELFTVYPFTTKLRILNNWTKTFNEHLACKNFKKGNFDVFHPTFYDLYYLHKSKLRGKPFVITIHDMIDERFFPDNSIIKNKHLLIKEASKVIAISENTKKDILKFVDTNPDKIHVVYHGCNMSKNMPIISPSIEIKNYILFVGSRGFYKNFTRFLKSFKLLSQRYSDLKLVCIGNEFNKEEQILLADLGLTSRVFLFKDLSDSELGWFYQHALCLVFPSLYEGFGLPILEAFTFECPLILSNSSCFPEIAGNAAIYFDPMDIDSIFDTLNQFLTDSSLSIELKQKGNLQLKHYSWEKTTNETVDVYKKAINE